MINKIAVVIIVAVVGCATTRTPSWTTEDVIGLSMRLADPRIVEEFRFADDGDHRRQTTDRRARDVRSDPVVGAAMA
jgi:hypothetical protein